jgi:hypothetical protein
LAGAEAAKLVGLGVLDVGAQEGAGLGAAGRWAGAGEHAAEVELQLHGEAPGGVARVPVAGAGSEAVGLLGAGGVVEAGAGDAEAEAGEVAVAGGGGGQGGGVEQGGLVIVAGGELGGGPGEARGGLFGVLGEGEGEAAAGLAGLVGGERDAGADGGQQGGAAGIAAVGGGGRR